MCNRFEQAKQHPAHQVQDLPRGCVHVHGGLHHLCTEGTIPDSMSAVDAPQLAFLALRSAGSRAHLHQGRPLQLRHACRLQVLRLLVLQLQQLLLHHLGVQCLACV